MIFFKNFPQMCTYANFFPPVFFLPILQVFYFRFFGVFFCSLSSFTQMKAYTVCARAQASIFTVLCPFSQRNCQIVKEVRTMREQVVKRKDLTRQTKQQFFYKLCEKCYGKSSKYMRNNSTRLKGKKKTSTSQFKKFRAQRCGDM